MDENRIGTSGRSYLGLGDGEMFFAVAGAGPFFVMHRSAIILAALERWNSFLTYAEGGLRVCWVVDVDATVCGLPVCYLLLASTGRESLLEDSAWTLHEHRHELPH